jgi:probable rRNA maturation factor
MEIFINDNQDKYPLKEKYNEMIFKIIEAIMFYEEFKKDFEICITIIDNSYIKQLNKDYRGIDRETDVLSFAMLDGEEFDIEINEVEPIILGDIFISIDKVIEQSKTYEHSFERELGFLVTHGVYHLLGYDHQDKESEKIMFDKQKKIMEAVGLKKGV